VGPDNGAEFDLYSNADSFAAPFETNVPKSSLTGGYYTFIPDLATSIKVSSVGGCGLQPASGIFLGSEPTPTPTPTPTATPTATPTPTPTSTPSPTATPTPNPTATPTPNPTATPTPTPTSTPTPTPSSVSFTLQYRYYAYNAVDGTKTVSNLKITLNSTDYTFSNRTFTTTTNTTQSQTVSIVPGTYGVDMFRNICSTLSGDLITNRTFRLVKNGSTIFTSSNTANLTMTVCPSQISQNVSLGSVTIGAGDTIQAFWEDELI
jgi:hypothetical protein